MINGPIIDAHIHLDQYEDEETEKMIISLDEIRCKKLISVSSDLASSKRNLNILKQYPEKVKVAFGFHPEQALPKEQELAELFQWMEKHRDEMVAIGEVGLPYYLRKEQSIHNEPYVEVLEQFIRLAKKWEKPLILHAIYEDAPLVCDLLETYSIPRAHFHWFKGDALTIERLIQNGYYISVTPDCLYEKEIQQIIRQYPLKQMMVETDGPWPFEGKFSGKRTYPGMIHYSIQQIATLKGVELAIVYETLYTNTVQFYR